MFKKKNFVLVFLILFLVSAVFTGCGNSGDTNEAADEGSNVSEAESILVFSGAGLRKPMDEIGKVFEEKYGVKVEYTYAGSAQNLSQLELSGEGDVYVPGSMYYYESGKEKGLVTEKKDVAYHIPVIAVPKGNPAGITCLEDLIKENVKVVLGDEKSAAIGKLSQKILKDNGLFEGVEKNLEAKAATVNELVVYMSMKQADASIIWEDNVMGVDEIEMVEIAKEKNKIKTIPVCIVKNSEKQELASKFVDFVTSEEGKQIYKDFGFKPVE